MADVSESPAFSAGDGYVVLRGLPGGQDAFLPAAMEVSNCTSVFSYAGGAYARNKVGNEGLVDVGYTDPAYDLIVHNEMAYLRDNPEYIAFYCVEPATGGGGETTLCDGRLVWAGLSAKARALFLHGGDSAEGPLQQFRYWQIFGNSSMEYKSRNDFMGLWQNSFGTDDKWEAEERARSLGYSVAWLQDDEMEVSFSRPAVRSVPLQELRNPETVTASEGEDLCFFDQIVGFHRRNCTGYARDGRPHFHVTLADEEGKMAGEIPDDVMQELEALIKRHTKVVEMAAGDVIVVDNRIVKHGRKAFAGQRQMVVALLTFSSEEKK